MDSSSSSPLLGNSNMARGTRALRRCSSDQAHHDLQQGPHSPLPARVNFAILTAPRAALILLVYIAVGTLCFLFVHHGFTGQRTVGVVDALYFCAVTMTTVGYGDLVPNTAAAKLFTCAYVFLGFGLIGIIVGNAANFFVEKQERMLDYALKYDNGRESHKQLVEHKVAVSAGLVVVVLAGGIGILMGVEKAGFVDAFYGVCVSATTLGYGDQAFRTTGGRICAVFWILVSTACVAQFMLHLAELITEERQHALTQWIIKRKVTVSDVEAADIDRDRRISGPEFVLYKLKELGKIEDDDVREIMMEFNRQDVDRSGTISISDVM